MNTIDDLVNENSALQKEQQSRPESGTGSMGAVSTKTPTLSTSPINVYELTDRIIVRLWEKMGHMYGHRWGSAYGEPMENGKLVAGALMWKKGLRDITAEQVAEGLSQCLERGDPWPPSLPEFRALCLGNSIAHTQNATAYQCPDCLALPKPRVDKSAARAMLEKIKRALHG